MIYILQVYFGIKRIYVIYREKYTSSFKILLTDGDFFLNLKDYYLLHLYSVLQLISVYTWNFNNILAIYVTLGGTSDQGIKLKPLRVMAINGK